MSQITITALIIFALSYILMMAFQKIRPYVAVGGALIFVALGIIQAVNPTLSAPISSTSATEPHMLTASLKR